MTRICLQPVDNGVKESANCVCIERSVCKKEGNSATHPVVEKERKSHALRPHVVRQDLEYVRVVQDRVAQVITAVVEEDHRDGCASGIRVAVPFKDRARCREHRVRHEHGDGRAEPHCPAWDMLNVHDADNAHAEIEDLQAAEDVQEFSPAEAASPREPADAPAIQTLLLHSSTDADALQDRYEIVALPRRNESQGGAERWSIKLMLTMMPFPTLQVDQRIQFVYGKTTRHEGSPLDDDADPNADEQAVTIRPRAQKVEVAERRLLLELEGGRDPALRVA